MSKGYDELASEVLASLLQARASAIAAIRDNLTAINNDIKIYLSDEAVAASYKAIHKAIIETANEEY